MSSAPRTLVGLDTIIPPHLTASLEHRSSVERYLTDHQIPKKALTPITMGGYTMAPYSGHSGFERGVYSQNYLTLVLVLIS
jgi:hypothetical protein